MVRSASSASGLLPGLCNYWCALLDDVLADGQNDCLWAVFHAKLLENAVDMCFDRAFRDTEETSDFHIATPKGNLLQNLSLSFRQRFKEERRLIILRSSFISNLYCPGNSLAGSSAPVNGGPLRGCTYPFQQHACLGIF